MLWTRVQSELLLAAALGAAEDAAVTDEGDVAEEYPAAEEIAAAEE